MDTLIGKILDEGTIFIINEYIITLIFIYFLVGGKRTGKQTVRDSIVAIAIAFIGDRLSIVLNFHKSIINGLNIELLWIYIFVFSYMYISYIYKRKNDLIVSILIFELIIFIHISIVQTSLDYGLFRNRYIERSNTRALIDSFIEWIIAPDLVIFLVVNRLKKVIEKNGMYFRRFEKNIMCISAFVYIVISIICSKIIDYADYTNTIQYALIQRTTTVFNILIVIMIILSLSFYILIGIKNMEIYLEENQSRLREKTMNYIKNAREYNENISKINHDFKNHMTVINLLSEDNEKIREYIRPLMEKGKQENLIVTGNSVVDIVLNEKVKDMKEFDIEYDIKAAVPPELKIDECDLASILFNTVDNAIEACSHVVGKRKIFIEMFVKGNKLLYNIENTYSESEKNKVRNYAQKKYLSGGFGTDIVREIAYRYNGDIDVSKKGGKYIFKTFIEV